MRSFEKEVFMILAEKVALVTGASRGIGAASAILLAHNGAAVVVNYFQSPDAANGVVEKIQAGGGKAFVVKADVRDPKQATEMVEETEKTLGPVDILVNNASIGFPIKPFMEFTWEEMEAKLTSEIRASFNCCQAVIPGMLSKEYGRIINISSGLSKSPGAGFVAHSTAKAGLDSFTRALAHEFGPNGITVNTVAPGLTETDATSFLPQEAKDGYAAHVPLRRIGVPDDVAGAVLFYASDYSRFLTGTYMPVDGGSIML